MKVIINGKNTDIPVAQISTLNEVISQIENTFEPGHIIKHIILGDKELEVSWVSNADKIYLLDEDTLIIKTEESAIVAKDSLTKSIELFKQLIADFHTIADSFRINEETVANTRFVQGIENLQWYLKILEYAADLLGRPLGRLMNNDVTFSSYVTELVGKLEQIIKVQAQKDWVMLADMIEYEMIPSLEKLGEIYRLLGVSDDNPTQA